jgi:hypothetical protein
VAGRTCLSPRLMAYAQHVREHFPWIIAGTTVADLDALADDVCTSLDDFPLTTGVLGCTVFEHGEAYTAIREGLRREHVCHAFAAELLLPHAAVLASVAVLIQAHAGGPVPSDATLDQLARRMASAYDVSLTAARISLAECLAEAS